MIPTTAQPRAVWDISLKRQGDRWTGTRWTHGHHWVWTATGHRVDNGSNRSRHDVVHNTAFGRKWHRTRFFALWHAKRNLKKWSRRNVLPRTPRKREDQKIQYVVLSSRTTTTGI